MKKLRPTQIIYRLKKDLAEHVDELNTMWKCHRVLLATIDRQYKENERLTNLVSDFKQAEVDRGMRKIQHIPYEQRPPCDPGMEVWLHDQKNTNVVSCIGRRK